MYNRHKNNKYSVTNSNLNSNNNNTLVSGSGTHHTALHSHNHPHLTETKWKNSAGPEDKTRTAAEDGVPSLDLSSLTFDDTDCNNSEFSHANSNNNNTKNATIAPDEKYFNKKIKSQFVFPAEKSIADYDGIRANPSHVVYEDPAVTSPFSQSLRPSFNEGSTMKTSGANRGTDKNISSKPEDRTIHFSLSNQKSGQYLVNEDGLNNVPQRPEEIVSVPEKEPVRRREGFGKANDRKTSDTKLYNSSTNNDISSDSDDLQDIIDVVIVNGHHKTETDSQQPYTANNDDGAEALELNLEEVSSEDTGEKPRPRVTFSFNDEIYSTRSLKRYTPMKLFTKPLQGVLKKRPEPVRVETSMDDTQSDLRHDYFKDAGVVFRKKPPYIEEGIPVKHLNSTTSDLEEARRIKSSSTSALSDKPPRPASNRIALSAAERSTVISSNRKLQLTGGLTGLTYVCSNAGGRIAYYRPSDGSRSTNDMKTKSKSTDDISGEDGTYVSQGKTSSARADNFRFTLRRCLSSEQSLISSGKTRPMKPKIAFGNFILPKETTPRLKNAQVKFQDIDAPTAPPLGSYVHSHTRRSPYAAPAQIIQRDGLNQTSVGSSRRPYIPGTKQPSQHGHHSSKEQLAQRHSAPSSYGSSRERGWRASRERLTIDNTPNRNQQNGSAISGHEILPNKTRIHSAGLASKKGRAGGSEPPQPRPDIAMLNRMANKAKGASQYRFLVTLKDYCKDT